MISEILEELKPYDCGLVAVSKTKPPEAILSIYNKGQRVFGENRAQELKEKAVSLPKDIQWHMIGHLQKNKVKYLIDHVSMIHSVDNLGLAQEINKRAKNAGRKIDVLLQLKIAEEATKSGFEFQDCLEVLKQLPNLELNNIV